MKRNDRLAILTLLDRAPGLTVPEIQVITRMRSNPLCEALWHLQRQGYARVVQPDEKLWQDDGHQRWAPDAPQLWHAGSAWARLVRP